MSNFIATIRAIFLKDMVSELRTKEVLPTMIVLGMLIAWVMRLVGEVASIETTTLGPAALWIAFLFAGLLVQDHLFAVEQRRQCISGLLLAPIDHGSIFLAKLLVAIVMLGIFELVFVPVILLTFELTAQVRWGQLLLVLLLVNIALSSVGTLFSAMVRVSRVRGSLLSILVLIVLMPIMIPASFAMLWVLGVIPAELPGSGALAMVGSWRAAFGYLAVFDAVFVTAGWLLFGFVVNE